MKQEMSLIWYDSADFLHPTATLFLSNKHFSFDLFLQKQYFKIIRLRTCKKQGDSCSIPVTCSSPGKRSESQVVTDPQGKPNCLLTTETWTYSLVPKPA